MSVIKTPVRGRDNHLLISGYWSRIRPYWGPFFGIIPWRRHFANHGKEGEVLSGRNVTLVSLSSVFTALQPAGQPSPGRRWEGTSVPPAAIRLLKGQSCQISDLKCFLSFGCNWISDFYYKMISKLIFFWRLSGVDSWKKRDQKIWCYSPFKVGVSCRLFKGVIISPSLTENLDFVRTDEFEIAVEQK
jgi:hypothetical protein